MACDKIQAMLPEMADAALGPRETLQVVEHLRQCQQCAISWKRHLEIQHYFLHHEPKLPESYWVHQRRAILDQIAWSSSQVKAVPARPRRVGWAAVGLAAAAAMLIGLVVFLLLPAAPSGGQPAAMANTQPPRQEPKPVGPTPWPAPAPKDTRVASDTTPAPQPTPQPTPAPEPPAPTTTPTPVPPPQPDPPEPSPEPAPPPSPEPMPAPPSPEPAPTPSPEPIPTTPSPQPQPPVPAMALPGDAGYRATVAEQQMAVFNARTEAAVMTTLLAAARKRLAEAKAACDAQREEIGEELVDSYVALVGNAAGEVYMRARADMAARKAAEAELGEQLKQAESLKGLMGRRADVAVLACKTAMRGGVYRPSLKKGKHGIVAAMQETARVAEGKNFDVRMAALVEVLDSRVEEIQRGGAVEAAAEYDAVLNRCVVPWLGAHRDSGKDIATSKARVMREVNGHIRSLETYQRRAPEASKPVVERALAAARTGRDAASIIPSQAIPNPPPPPPPPPSPTPTPTPEPAPNSDDKGFEPPP